MATRRVEQEHVSKVCNDLVRAGEEPSTLKVRKMLGKGSHSTIQKFIKVWKESEEGQAIHVENLPAVVELPDEFKEGADLFIKQIFKLASDHHAAVTEQIKQACDQTVEKSLKEVREAVDYVETVDQENADLKDSLETLGQEKTTLLGEKSDLEKAKAELDFRVKSLEEKRDQKEAELSQSIKDLDGLKAQIEDQEGRLNTASKEIVGYKKEIDLLTATNVKQAAALTADQEKINNLSGDLKTCQKELATAQATTKKVADRLDAEKAVNQGLSDDLKEQKRQLSQKESELSGVIKDRDDLAARVKALESDLGKITKEYDQKDKALVDAKKEIATLTKAQAQDQKQIKVLEGAVETSKDNISQAQIKNAELKGELKAVNSQLKKLEPLQDEIAQLKADLKKAKADEQRWITDLEMAQAELDKTVKLAEQGKAKK